MKIDLKRKLKKKLNYIKNRIKLSLSYIHLKQHTNMFQEKYLNIKKKNNCR